MDVEKIKKLRLDTPSAPEPETGRARHRGWIVLAAVLLLLTGLGWFGFRPRDASASADTQSGTTPTSASAPAPEPPSPPLTVSSPAPTPSAATVAAPSGTFVAAGYVEPIPPYPIKVISLIEGRLEEFDLLEGTPVKKGQSIARLDTSKLALEAKEASAAVEAGAARVAHARAVVGRSRGLAEIGSISRSQLAQAEAELAALEAEGRRVEAAFATLRWRIENSIIRSPADGVIYERLGHAGQWVGPGHESAIATIYDPARLQIWVDVNQREAHRVREGQRVEITADAAPGRTFTGRVVRIQPRASLAKNTIQAKIELDEPATLLRPDLSVRVVFYPSTPATAATDPVTP